jgi:NADH:ubiquinone oxidoreductase subunit 2 (subunit N)
MTVSLSVCLLSLLGIPPLVGFVAKMEIFMALWQGARDYQAEAPALAGSLYTAFVFLGLNSVLSAVYYVKVMKTMIIDERPEDVEGRPAQRLREDVDDRAFALVMSLLILVGIFVWTPLDRASRKGSYVPTESEDRPARVAADRGGQP